MWVRQLAKSRGLEMRLPISDRADRNELNLTLCDIGAPKVRVTHRYE
jgi:hypothetical protein